VLDQTYPIDQIVVIDDGSRDDTAAVVRDEASGDPRVVIVDGGGQGTATATNMGLDALRTQFAAIQHQDDRWDSHKIATQVAVMRPGVSIVGTRMRYLGPSGRVKGRTPFGPLTSTQVAQVRAGEYSPCPPSALLVRTADAVRVRFPLDFMPSDLAFVRALACEGEVIVLDEPLGDYRLHAGASTLAVYTRARLAPGYFAAQDRARAAGRDLSFADYMDTRRLTLNERRRFAAGLWGRRAATHALGEDYPRALGNGILAAAAAPVTTARGVIRLLHR
jgi:glycosyltransferase involved in cell wall biosynthesis